MSVHIKELIHEQVSGIKMPSAPLLPSMLEAYIHGKRQPRNVLNGDANSRHHSRADIDMLANIHQLYLQHISYAHREFLQLKASTMESPQHSGIMLTPPDKRALVANGLRYDSHAMLHCSSGKPSAGFGPLFRKFDTSGRVSRLPRPPYQFLTRIVEVDGKMGEMKTGIRLTAEYDIPDAAWYFEDNDGAMPHAVLMEAVLQPCGWLSVYMGIPLQTEEPLFVRNLDGRGTQYVDIKPSAGILRTTVTLRNISRANHTFIHTYEVESSIDNKIVYKGETTFGHFPEKSLAHQAGLAPADILPDSLLPMEETCTPFKLITGKLQMIDRIVQYTPDGGLTGLGRVIAEKDIKPDAWFFKAHFYQDPVQPGSLGIEAMLQVLKWTMREQGLDRSFEQPRFEAIRTNRPMSWKYRGHVVPSHQLVRIVVDVLEQGKDEAGVYLLADAILIVDGMPIYKVNSLGMRIVETARQPIQQPINLQTVQSYWEQETRMKEWIIFDIYESLKHRFVNQIHIIDSQRLQQYAQTPMLFLANHQTAVESPIFNYIVSGLQQIPLVGLAKAEHRFTWLGRLMDLAAEFPGARLSLPMKFIEREDQISAYQVLQSLGPSMQQERYSTLIHVEGTRSHYAGQPVQTISSMIIEQAIVNRIPTVPVRFIGGLPNHDEGQRYEFPYAFGKQDYWIGSPILPHDLELFSQLDRKKVVLEAINQLGPAVESERPASPSATQWIEQVTHWCDTYGVAMEWAVILQCLAEFPGKCEQTKHFLDYVQGGASSFHLSYESWFHRLYDLMRGS